MKWNTKEILEFEGSQTSEEDEKKLRALAESDQLLNIRLTNDFAFKKAFRNKKAMTGLLSALLNLPAYEIKTLEFPDTFAHGEYADDREGILDVKVHLNGNRKINIEIQVLPYPFWEERSLFYISRMFVEDFIKGQGYQKLEECIHISILGFSLKCTDHFYSVIRLMDEKTRKVYSDKLSLRMLYLNQIEQVSEEERQTEVYQWAKLISAKDWKVLMKMAERNEYMKETISELEKINSDKELRYRYLKRELRGSDEATIRNYYLDKGKVEGESLILDLVCKMLENGRSKEEIDRMKSDNAFKEEMVKKYINF